jgi:hypothetical protein
MGLKSKMVRWFALRWLKGQVEDGGSMIAKMKEALSGWKLLIGVVALGTVKVYDAMSNGNAGDIVGAVLKVLGWMPEQGLVDWGTLVPALVIIIGAARKLWRAQVQARAGSSMTGLLSAEGYVKAERAKALKR